MTARDIFGVILRVCGLVLVYRGFGVLWFQIAIVFAPGPGRMLMIPFLHGAVMFGLGLYLMRGAPAVMQFCYPDREER
jgi:hypothetical protein